MRLGSCESSLFVFAASLCLCGLAGDAAGYDYSEPMPCVEALPLGYPEAPFVLRFTPEELEAQPRWSSQVDAIVYASGAPAPIRTGVEALRGTLTRLGLGDAAPVELDPATSRLPARFKGERLIVLGTSGGFALADALARKAGLEVSDAALNGDGFVIKPLKQGRREILLIVSPEARGVLYGAYELEERCSKRGVPAINQRFAPAVRYRGWPMHAFIDEPPDAIGRWRLNISMAWSEFCNSLLFYREFPELGGESHKDETLERQEKLHKKYANAARYGAMAAVTWNPLSFSFAPPMGSMKAHQEALDHAHPGILARPFENPMANLLGSDRKNLCPSDPATRRYVESAVEEFMTTFPEIDLINLMFSDIGGELTCGCDKCSRYPFLDRVADYTQLVVRTARRTKPAVRFMMLPGGLMFLTPMHYPELGGDLVAGLNRLKEAVGADVEAFLFCLGSPPGGDCQSWLAPDCTMLGQGIPLYFLFQHYEADGPGIVSPISPIISHLSWSLPIHLQTLQRYAAQGMTGALFQGAGLEVGLWHPDLDANQYMRNWCRAKYGAEAGAAVVEALRDTHKITEAFRPDTKPGAMESLDFYRWGPYLKPWATDMEALRGAGLSERETAETTANIVYGFMIPQAPQPDGLRNVTPDSLDPWLKRFACTEASAVAARAERMLAVALAKAPGNAEIQRLHELALATQALVGFYSEYHLALAEANCARNAGQPGARQEHVRRSREHLLRAVDQAAVYRDHHLPLIRNLNEKLWSIRYHAPVKYTGSSLGILREAAYLLDQEFGGHEALDYCDSKLKLTTPGERP